MIVQQQVDKVSETCDIDTSVYYRLYEKTKIKLLQEKMGIHYLV